MQCPRCKSQSVRLENGAQVCGFKECTYIDFHPISFDNDVRNYEGEDRRESRISSTYSNLVDNGRNQLDRQASIDDSYKKGSKIISNWCFLLGQSQNITEIATARLLNILRIMNQSSLQQQPKEGEIIEQQQIIPRKRRKQFFSIKNMAAYCIYSACFEKGNYFEEFSISKTVGLSLKDWKKLVNEMNSMLRFKIDFVPIMQPKHIIMRVCRKLKIRNQENNAMLQMCQRISKESGIDDARINTIAAIIFWKVVEHSQLYKGKFPLRDICKNHDKMINEKITIKDIQKCFDVTPDTVRKVFNESIGPMLYNRYLPNWEGRIPLNNQVKEPKF